MLGQTTLGQTNDKPHRLFKHNPAFIIVFRSKYKFKRKLITCDKRTFRNQSAVCLIVSVDSPEQCVCVCVYSGRMEFSLSLLLLTDFHLLQADDHITKFTKCKVMFSWMLFSSCCLQGIYRKCTLFRLICTLEMWSLQILGSIFNG